MKSNLFLLSAIFAGLAPEILYAEPHNRPDRATAKATVFARILSPVTMRLSPSVTTAAPNKLTITAPTDQVFQLHIGSTSQHSYDNPAQQQSFKVALDLHKSPQSPQTSPNVTLYFN